LQRSTDLSRAAAQRKRQGLKKGTADHADKFTVCVAHAEKQRLQETRKVTNTGETPVARAPVKAIELSGESPDRGDRYRPVVNGNCVFNRKGGEQLKANEQSVTVL
jgi:hypothetical protein